MMQATRKVLLCCLPLGWVATCHAGDPPLSGPPAAGPQIMIYFKQPLGHFAASRVYGFRLDRASAASSSPSSMAAPLRRREILNFEIAPHGDIHMSLGRRLFYDVGRNEFALSATHATMPLNLATPMTIALAPAVTAH